jgi:hypothetical protein
MDQTYLGKIKGNSSGLCEKHAIKTPKNLQPGPGYLPKNLAV